MTLIIIISILIISILIYSYIPKNASIYKLKNILSKSECEELISMAKDYKFLETLDPVDNKPVYQIELLEDDRTMNYPELYDKCADLYKKRLPKQKGTLDYIFLKRYTPGERVDIPMHIDMSRSTINILLSDPNEYEGGEFYLFNDPQDIRASLVEKHGTTLTKKNKMIQTMKNLPIVHMKQGDMITYAGSMYSHGVLPVTSGVRYVLTYFFEYQ